MSGRHRNPPCPCNSARKSPAWSPTLRGSAIRFPAHVKASARFKLMAPPPPSTLGSLPARITTRRPKVCFAASANARSRLSPNGSPPDAPTTAPRSCPRPSSRPLPTPNHRETYVLASLYGSAGSISAENGRTSRHTSTRTQKLRILPECCDLAGCETVVLFSGSGNRLFF
jgi:hypothetical protein